MSLAISQGMSWGMGLTLEGQGHGLRPGPGEVASTWLVQSNLWVVAEDLRMVSDPLLFGRHLIELNATNVLVRSYVWGLDLSETLEGAGGGGALLWVTLHTGSGCAAGTHFAAYDGNGNVVTLVSATTGTETARYEYGPFGEPLRVTGPAAALNPFRFSTKRADSTTDMVLYEYRAYSSSLGRWLSRDPLGEGGGVGLHGFVANGPVARVDMDGRLPVGKILLGVGICTSACCALRIHGALWESFWEVERKTGRDPGPAGSPEDALKHCVAACHLAKEPGCCFAAWITLLILNARENDTPEGRMDVQNNQAGSRIGRTGPAAADCFEACRAALEDGHLACLDQARNIVPCRSRAPSVP